MATELKPRLCFMLKGENGYGFHLHGEKGKTGQYIRKVEPASPAEASGLRAGDRVVEVNGENVEGDTHHQVVQRIKAVKQETRLLVVDHATDEHLRRLRLACTEELATNIPDQIENSSATAPSVARIDGGLKPINPTASSNIRKPQEKAALMTGHQPRLCRLQKGEMGYGFNLHSEKALPGQYIRSVDPGSPAEQAGLRPKDRLIEVNGVNIERLRHSEVVTLIKSGGSETQLLVVDPELDEHLKKLGVIPKESSIKEALPITNGFQKPRTNGSSVSQSSQSTNSERNVQDTSLQLPDEDSRCLLDPFTETGLRLSPTAAEAKEKVHSKRAKKRAPQMDWSKKYEIFSNF